MSDSETTAPGAFLDAVSLGAAIAEPAIIESDGIPYVAVPQNYRIEPLEHLLPQPRRVRGRTVLDDVDSFVRYVGSFYTGETRIYYRVRPAPSFTAVIDDCTRHALSWREHIAHYPCPLSREWQTWTGNDGKRLAQVDFAQFLEDNLPDVREPSGADMLGVATTLEAKRTVAFSSGTRLDNGQVQLTYVEQIKGTASKGEMRIPEQFTIAIPVFEGGDRYALKARLRYRIPDNDKGGLTMWYQLLRPEDVIEHAANELRLLIESKIPAPMLRGSPPLA